MIHQDVKELLELESNYGTCKALNLAELKKLGFSIFFEYAISDSLFAKTLVFREGNLKTFVFLEVGTDDIVHSLLNIDFEEIQEGVH